MFHHFYFLFLHENLLVNQELKSRECTYGIYFNIYGSEKKLYGVNKKGALNY
jgi:hypothetical protein